MSECIVGVCRERVSNAQSIIHSMSHAYIHMHHIRQIRLREEQSGINYIPYYCGKLLAIFMMEVLVFPIAFLLGYYPFSVPAGTVFGYYTTLVLLQVAVYSLCHFVSVVCRRESMSLVLAGTIVVLWVCMRVYVCINALTVCMCLYMMFTYLPLHMFIHNC